MLDFRYAENIRKLLQIEKVQEKIGDFNLVIEMLMEDSYTQKLAELDECKGPMLGRDRLIEYIVLDSYEDSQIVEFVSVQPSAEESYYDVKYKYIFKPNKGIMSSRVRKVYVEDEFLNLEKGRTTIMAGECFTPWKLDRLYACDWSSEELESLASMGYAITGITYVSNILGIRGRLYDDICVMLYVEKTETTEKDCSCQEKT